MRRLLLSVAVGVLAASPVLAAEPMSLTPKSEPPVKGEPAKAADADLEEVLKVIEAAYRGAKLEKAPISAAQLEDYAKRAASRDQAASGARTQEANMVTASRTISLAPGSKKEEILVAAGYSSTVVFLDASGQPWPVESYGVGNDEAYQIPKPPDGDHTLTIFLKKRYEPSNLVVRLKGLPTPVNLALKDGLKDGVTIVNDRFDARIPVFAPGSKVPIVSGVDTLTAGDALLMTVLDGVPPDGAQRVDIAGGDPRTAGWLHQGAFYVRTQHQLLSPAWQAHVSSADGTTAYRLAGMVPVLVMSEDGQMVRVNVEKSHGRR